jgi:hypothetical protein
LAGVKGYVANLENPDPDFVIGAHHQRFEIEKSFRMSKHDLQSRPIFHHRRESIQAHLNVVFAALAISRSIEATPAGRSRSSSAQPAATAPLRSKPAHTRSPPTPYPTTSTTRSAPSTLRTKLSQVG